MDEEEHDSLLQESFEALAAWVHSVVGSDVVLANVWTEELVTELSETVLSNREGRILFLLCDGPRPSVTCQELADKFGCGIPYDASRDTPRIAAFCKKHELHCRSW